MTKLDGIVNKIVHMQFERIRNEPPQDLIERQNAKEIDIAKAELKRAQGQMCLSKRDMRGFGPRQSRSWKHRYRPSRMNYRSGWTV